VILALLPPEALASPGAAAVLTHDADDKRVNTGRRYKLRDPRHR
jgi:hypothetical protein